MPYIGQLQYAGLGKESTVGTGVSPTEFIPLIPPDGFFPSIKLLESTAVRNLADVVYKVSQGEGKMPGKMKWEAEPENIGNLLSAAFGTDTKTNSGTAYTHTFSRVQAAELNSYTWLVKKGAKYIQADGCMLNKMELTSKAGEFLMVDTDWLALAYDDTGSTQSTSYSPINPFKFDMLVVTVAGSQVNNYDNVKVTFDNMVETAYTLHGSIYPGKIYSKGFKVTISMDLVMENTTEYAKFLAGTSTHINLAWTHPVDIPSSSTQYSLTIDLPSVNYSAASLPLPNGLIKINFTGTAVYNTDDSYTAQAALVNGVTSAY